jgi:hypothetical protein
MSTQKEEVTSLFEACQPRSDVIDGTLEEEQFAANLATVAHEPDEAAPVYRDAIEFFDTKQPLRPVSGCGRSRDVRLQE